MNQSTSLNIMRNSSSSIVTFSRRVSFPKSDDELVTGYLEPANPWEHVCMIESIPEIGELYISSCEKHNTKPLQCILDHLKTVDLQNHLRQPLLSLKSIKLTPSDCEALEEVFKRIQYKTIDLSNCNLNETAASALFEIIEYYEATNELDISSNARGMTHRGWTSCNYMIGHSQELLVLNAEGNPISKVSAENLGSALCTSNLHTLKLEHCGLRGSPLFNLCFKLRHNRILKELWLGNNDLECNDADTIAELLKTNHYLELIDVSNNNIRDEGLRHIVIALIMQSKELERRRTLQRTFASDKYDTISPSTIESSDSDKSNEWNIIKSAVESRDRFDETKMKLSLQNQTDLKLNQRSYGEDFLTDVNNSLPEPIATEEVDSGTKTNATVQSKTVRITQNVGQSMLDKLLSMSSEGSNENVKSNLSTDTLAACCPEEANLISDDTFNNVCPSNNNTNMSTLMGKEESSSKSSNAKVITPYTSPSGITSDHLIENTQENSTVVELTEITELTAKPADLFCDKTGFPNQCCNQDNNFVNNNNCSEHHLAAETFTNNNSFHSTNNLRDQSPMFKVTEEAKEAGMLSDTEKIDANNVNSCTKILDVNKNTKLGEDFDDTHSTDSAFESASEGDISRNLPEELTRLSDSLDTMKFDDFGKDFVIETPNVNYNSNEYLIPVPRSNTPPSRSTSRYFFEKLSSTSTNTSDTTLIVNNSCLSEAPSTTACGMPFTLEYQEHVSKSLSDCCIKESEKKNKGNVSQCRLDLKCRSNNGFNTSGSATLVQHSTFTSSASNVLRRLEPSCTFLTESSRTYSQSTDSLCSDNSLDGSTGSTDTNYSTNSQLNEKLTKNDTLTRQQRQVNVTTERFHRIPSGLKVLSVWNNNITKEAGLSISDLLTETISLELLNIGKNCLSNDFLLTIKESLTKNKTLTTIGLQSAHLSAKGIETLSSILNFGGNNVLQRIDIRDNVLEVDSLNTIADVLKSNTTVTQIDIDDEPKRLSVGSEAHLEYTHLIENVRSICSRNEKAQLLIQTEKSSVNVVNKKRGGYYMGSRKISLTCYGRPIVDNANKNRETNQHLSTNKLDVKRKSGTRLRSPVPSPPSVSPSSSPNRTSRFQVFRVAEISPLTSFDKNSLKVSSNSVIPNTEGSNNKPTEVSNSLPLSYSLPSMAMISSSTQSIKRLTDSPRSRFHVKRIYEDSILQPTNPHQPISSVTTIITPPISSTHTVGSWPNDGNKFQVTTQTTEVPTQCTTTIPFIITTVSWSIATLVEPTTENNTSTTHILPEDILIDISKTQITAAQITSSGNTNNVKVCPTTFNLQTNSSQTLPKTFSPAQLGCSSLMSLSLLSPSTSLSSLSSTDENVTSASVLTEIERQAEKPALGQCPLAIFSENDITLTKNTSTNLSVKGTPSKESNSFINTSMLDTAGSTIAPHRIRKSLIPNSTAVDKLLTLFHHPNTIFQRSTSSDTNMSGITSVQLNQPGKEMQIIGCQPIPEIASIYKKSPLSLARLCDINLNATASTHVNTPNNDSTESSKQSFLDEASKQFRDFSKQILITPNLSFVGLSSTLPTFNKTFAVNVGAVSRSNDGDCPAHGACVGCDLIPTDLEAQAKENVSSEYSAHEKPSNICQITELTNDEKMKNLESSSKEAQ